MNSPRQRSSLRFSKDVTYLEHTISIPIGAITVGRMNEGGREVLRRPNNAPDYATFVVPSRSIGWNTSDLEIQVQPKLLTKLVEAAAQMMALVLRVQVEEEDFIDDDQRHLTLGQVLPAFPDGDPCRTDDNCDVEWDGYHLVDWPTVTGNDGFTYYFDNWPAIQDYSEYR